MVAATTDEAIAAMVSNAEETHLVRPEVGALEAITRSEVAMQLDSAHRWPRSPSKFLKEAIGLATFSAEIAESCIYSVPRGDKVLTGPSVRLAEICASSWRNLHVGARVIDETHAEIIAQAVAWDLESNLRITIEAARSIIGKAGRYNDDMIRVTGMAAISIALRNAIFRVIPKTYVDAVYKKACAVAVGDAETIKARREEVMQRLLKMGIRQERVFARLGIGGSADITVDHLQTLIGLGTSVRTGEISVDQAFPAAATTGAAPAPDKAATTDPLDQIVSRAKQTPAAAPTAKKIDRDKLFDLLVITEERWIPLRDRVDAWTDTQALAAMTFLMAIQTDISNDGSDTQMPAHLRLDD